MSNRAYLSLGSNIGDREQWIIDAVRELNKVPGIDVEKVSSIYETVPVGYTEQDLFLNIAIGVTTTLSAHELLTTCLAIEEKLGRVREFRWGPRKIDLDILLYNKENIEMKDLEVPHPRMAERAFVLVPLLEIAQDIELPGTGMNIAGILKRLPDKEGVHLWKRISGAGASALLES